MNTMTAHDLGLGAVWTGVYPMEERVAGFRKLLNLPEQVIPMALVVLGYAAQKVQPEERYLPERVHQNRW